MKFLVLSILFTSHILAQQKAQVTQSNCVVQSHDKVCCDRSSTVEIAVIKSQSEFENRKDYPSIKGTIGLVDFNSYDLIVAWPDEVKMTFEFIGTPTTLGTEWKIYKSFSIGCNQDSMTILLDCSPTAGSSGAFYWKKVSKLNVNKFNCSCKAINNINSVGLLKPNVILKNEQNEYVYYAGSSAKPGKILKNKMIRAPKIPKYTNELLKPKLPVTAVVKGKVKPKDEAEGTIVLFTNLNKGTSGIGSVRSGSYEVALDPGVYKVEFKNPDNTSIIIDKLELGEGQIQKIDVELGEGPKEFKIISKKPLSDAGLKKRIKQLEK